jgi:outer membrane protein OmpA-like peptidoglycan-associated protein
VLLFLLVSSSLFAQTGVGCFKEYTNKFEKFGALTVPDGMQNVVVGVITIGGGNNCVMGKILVKDETLVPPLYLVQENGELVRPNDTLSTLFYRQAHDENRLYKIDNGMSAIVETEKKQKARLFFIDYLKADPGGLMKAGSLNSADAAKIKLESKAIQFNTGKDVIATESYSALNAISEVIIKNPDIKWTINGYTDNVGKANSNLVLSKKRADAVKKYLISKGVNRDSITAIGHGIENPISDNNTPEGRAANRRVEIVPVQ